MENFQGVVLARILARSLVIRVETYWDWPMGLEQRVLVHTTPMYRSSYSVRPDPALVCLISLQGLGCIEAQLGSIEIEG